MLKHTKTCILVTVLCVMLMSLALPQLLSAAGCSQRVGPFTTQYEAAQAAQYYSSRGYGVSGVWGEGGVVSSWSNRRYYFNIFWNC